MSTSLYNDHLEYITKFIYKHAGIVLTQEKSYLIETRLREVARIVGEPDLNQLIERLKTTGDVQLKTLVVDALTTNETMWFRDRRPFEALKNHVLPALQKAKPDRTLRIWSAACSTGQEPYSLAIMLEELGLFKHWDITIYATDIANKVIQKAMDGIYTQFEISRGLPAKYLVKYFQQLDGDQWQISRSIRNMVRFQRHNILTDLPPHRHLDLVLCRNVLIYFDAPSKQQILKKIHKVLNPEGFLMLGSSESTLGITDQFEHVQFDGAIFFQPAPAEQLVKPALAV